MSRHNIRISDVLQGPFWPEAVRVLNVRPVGSHIQIDAVGTKTQQFYSRMLAQADIDEVRIISTITKKFSGNAEAFFLAVEAHRIRFAYQFDPLFAVSISQVDPLPHQIEAVYHHLLRSPRIRFLLADDPGAGKTIMAGLLLKELKYRGLVKRVLIVVPGHLKDQWRRELKERFAETFMVVDRAVMNATWGRNIWQEQSQLITSMDFAKQDDVMAGLAEAQWDLVIVDEAHKMAAYRYGEKTNKTERYRFGELLSRNSQFLLLLTATPHRGDPENFRLFLDLLEPGMFASKELLLESVQAGDNPLFLRRLKEDLRDFDGRPLFPPRHVFTRPYRLSAEEKRLYNAVTAYVEQSYNKALASQKRNVAFALLILQRRLASSVRAVRRSLERRKDRLSELLRIGKWLAERDRVDEEALEDAPEAVRLLEEDKLLEQLTAAETREELEAEIETLKQLIQLAREAERQEIETKLGELRQVMEDERIGSRGEKLLIFTESRETLDYLAEKLQLWGYSVVTLHGAMNLDGRIGAEHQFREKAQVMVSTEAGGEGINLQFCSLMVNYDIPWNPNRLEQRMGRIHRYGQQKEVHIYNLVASDTREGLVLRTLFEKVEKIRQALGSDRVFDVIGEIVPGRSLKELIIDAISRRRTLEEIVAEIETIPDINAIQKTREAALEALATRHIDLQRILGEDRRARENRLVPEYIGCFFERACRFLQIPLQQRRDGLWRVSSVPYELRQVSQQFKNSYGEVFHEYNKIAFDKKTAHSREATFVAPGHPLLESIIETILVRYRQDLHDGAVFADPDGRLNGWIYFVQGEIRDGTDQIAGKRLFAIFRSLDGDQLRLVNSSLLWDLKPLEGTQAKEPVPPQDDIIAFVIEHALEPYRREILQEREREAHIKRKYGIRSLEQLINDAQARLIDYETRRAMGESVPEVDIINEQRRKEDYEARRRALENEIRWQTRLSAATPEIVGVARVVPQAVQDYAMHSDAEIEAIGMRLALVYEREHGRTPADVSARNLGYDICSVGLENTVRYIEVKARATTGPIVLTPNEWLMAQRLSNDYWLYIVENAATSPVLHTIQNPAAKLRPQEVTDVIRYVVREWKQALE
ncbi:MAG: helicase-related protein [Gemmataceae bacterium]|nr:helicase-related protein [Gemmataceae bacterium]MDW8224132.1 helicase-related protein [Gemmatales bacterium]MDW8244070.1 helicase-related protein [Thermogemmata sp.]